MKKMMMKKKKKKKKKKKNIKKKERKKKKSFGLVSMVWVGFKGSPASSCLKNHWVEWGGNHRSVSLLRMKPNPN